MGEEPEHLRKIFIGGLSPETNDDSLRSYFSKYGEIVDCIVMRDNLTKRSRGFGFVTFADPGCVDHVQSERPHVLDGKQVDTKRVVPKNEKNSSSNETVKKVFVGGLKDQITDQDLKEFFSQYGSVERIETFTDKQTGRKKGFAFVTFGDYDSVDKCILQATSTPDRKINIQGVKVEVKKARSQQEIKNEGGGRGGGGFGGGRGGFNQGSGYGDYGGNQGYNQGGGYNQGYGGGNQGYGGGYGDGGFNQGYANGYNGASGGGGGNWNSQGGWGGNQGGGGGGYNQGGGYNDFSGGGPMRGGGGGYGNARQQSAPYGGYKK